MTTDAGGHGGALSPGSAGAPLHARVRVTVLDLITNGSWTPGARIPSSRRLAEDLGLSRTTVQVAYQQLIDEGYLVARDRRGVFVNPALPVSQAAAPDQGAWGETLEWERIATAGRDGPWSHLVRRKDWARSPYPFVTGQHDPANFPREAWLASLRKALGPEHRHASLDDTLGDDQLLVEVLCRTLLPARGLHVQPDNVLITLGSQQGLHLLARATVRRGARCAVEDPGYLDARHIFARAGAQVVPVPVDADGLIPDPGLLAGARLVFTTPSHQHPTNVTLSAERRLELIHLADREDFLVIEDDYDSELRYRGRPSPAMTALDPSGRTVYLGSVSKLFAPGLRIGFVVAPRPLIAVLRHIRRYEHRQPPGHQQRALALMLDSGDYARSLRRYRCDLAARWQMISRLAAERFPRTGPLPPGGTSLWLTAAPGVDTRELASRADERGVLFDPGDIYYATPAHPTDRLRLGFAAIAHDRIAEGLDVLARLAAT